MFLHALTHCVPPQSYTQSECWDIAQQSPVIQSLQPRSVYLLERLLTNPNGVEKRHFAARDIEQLFNRPAEQLNRDFQEAAPALAGRALDEALESAGLRPADLDALIVCTCTGYLCPGVSSYLAEQRGLRPDCFLQDLVGLGCGAAIPALRNAAGVCAAAPAAKVAVIAVEICSAAFYVADDPGVLVSLCLFADGASASIWSGETPTASPPWRASAFDTIHQPQNRELLRFVNRNGFLRNQLDPAVPARAADAVSALFERAQPAGEVVAHGGGRDVIEALRGRLPGHPLHESARVLRDYGNLSSPSVLFALRERLDADPGANDLWLTSFGAGFAAHACALTRE